MFKKTILSMFLMINANFVLAYCDFDIELKDLVNKKYIEKFDSDNGCHYTRYLIFTNLKDKYEINGVYKLEKSNCENWSERSFIVSRTSTETFYTDLALKGYAEGKNIKNEERTGIMCKMPAGRLKIQFDDYSNVFEPF